MGMSTPAVEILDPARTALLVVDLQERLLPAITSHERVLANSLLLLRRAREIALPVVVTTQYRRGLGETVPSVRELAGVEPLDKTSFGCFGDDAFRAHLKSLGRDQLLVAGIEAHICVTQTVLGALATGYRVHVASDAVGSRTEANRQVGLERMKSAGALLSSAEMALYELLGRSDGAAFKALLPHLKGRSAE
jgi:nicotinamidase-related amidase